MIWQLLLWFESVAAAANPTNNDDWLHPRIDTTGTYSTDSDPDVGPAPSTLSTAINPVPE